MQSWHSTTFFMSQNKLKNFLELDSIGVIWTMKMSFYQLVHIVKSTCRHLFKVLKASYLFPVIDTSKPKMVSMG